MIFFLGWIALMILLTAGGAVLGADNQQSRPGSRADRLVVGAAAGGLLGFFAGLLLTFIGFLVAGAVI